MGNQLNLPSSGCVDRARRGKVASQLLESPVDPGESWTSHRLMLCCALRCTVVDYFLLLTNILF